MEYDCGFTKEDKSFRYRAAAIIIENGCVLFVSNDIDDYYYSVGGGVQIGEKAEDAVKREVYEEVGVHYEVERLAFIHENFFVAPGTLEGYQCHEVAFYFLMKSRGSQDVLGCSCTNGLKEYTHWIPIDKIGEYKAYPEFFREKLVDMKPEVEHIITNE